MVHPVLGIFGTLKLLQKHIALFFLGLLMATLVPYNALHSHEEHEHFLTAHHSHENEHHCEIDDLFCETGYDHACEHGTHIKADHPECFTCEFSFVKHFIHSVQTETYIGFTIELAQVLATQKKASAFAQMFSSRGPPALS